LDESARSHAGLSLFFQGQAYADASRESRYIIAIPIPDAAKNTQQSKARRRRSRAAI
jgi:hypothetical protein